MPWCGYWATADTTYWWVLPLIGLVFMAVMFFACSRGFGCMGAWRRRFAGDHHAATRGRERGLLRTRKDAGQAVKDSVK